MPLNNLLSLRIACDGEGGSGKSTAAKLISKKYNLFYMNSGLLFRYASSLIIKHRPKKVIPFLRKGFKKISVLLFFIFDEMTLLPNTIIFFWKTSIIRPMKKVITGRSETENILIHLP